MTLFEFEELATYWAAHPPVHILVGAYLGVGKDTRKPGPSMPTGSGRETGTDLRSVLAELGPGFGAGDVHAGLAPVVLDFAELQRRAEAID
jgi:hypothetical protein